MRPNLTPQELEELQRVTGRDPYPNNFPDDYDKSKIDSRVLKRSSSVDIKLFGGETREAMKQGIEISSVVSTEAKELADETAERQDNLEERWNAVVSETTDGAEVIEARVDTEGVRQPSLSARLLKDFTDRLTKAQLIKFLAGEDIEVTVTSDFTGKVAGSNVENGNKIFDHNAATVQLPSAFTAEASQEGYDLIKLLDGKTYDARYTASTRIAQRSPRFDALWILEKNFPQIFKNATTTAEKVAIAKSKITKFQYNVWAKASGPTNTLCSHSLYNPSSNSWGVSTTSTGTSITQRIITSNNASTPAYLTNDGYYYFVTYAEASNGTISSSVSTDYTNMSLTLKFNISDFVATKAQYDALKKVVDDLKIEISSNLTESFIRSGVNLSSVKFIGHRGLSSNAPENTIESFQQGATRRGAFWGIETDVHRTKDGFWVCMHDPTVDRTTDGTGAIKDLTLAQIKALTIDYGSNIGTYPGLKVPTFEEYLTICKKNSLVPIIELKDTASYPEANYDSFVDLVKRKGFENKCVVISFEFKALEAIRKRSNRITLQYLVNTFNTAAIEQASTLTNCGINSQHAQVTQALVEACHSKNMEVNAWTVNDYPIIEQLTEMGVDYITTDRGAGRFVNKEKTFMIRKAANQTAKPEEAYSTETPYLEWQASANRVLVHYEYPFQYEGMGATSYLTVHAATKEAGYTFATQSEYPNNLALMCYKNGVRINPMTTSADDFWVGITVKSF
ncbi:glycerophosphodiester phosphodiesterase family protein [Carnobacterium maltaromaticum]|uniref:glycerophosphodiester phosphodiesterase n=1 Tax=Carnobacterium maltaromaticum TaxID=2751 RepID=UPI00298A8804|nr:glycerophosphodiester phosphodiesterase family protein [Carnobacterium maltaromaticum]MDW5522156.1 glycerophosphodiester phosphodiesterase family protein [Carnobacterium maltaromaticum]